MMTDDKKISRLYKQGKEVGPPAHLDNTILSAARDAVQDEAVQDKQQAEKSATTRKLFFASPFSGGWRAPASIAAILVITVILVPLLQQEEMSPTVSRVADDAPPILKKEQDLIGKISATKESREANIAASKTEKKRSQTTVLEQRQPRPLSAPPQQTLNRSTSSRSKQFSIEEKIAPVRTLPAMTERSISAGQQPQPAATAAGTDVLHDQVLYDQKPYDQKPGAPAKTKQQGRRMLVTDEMPSVFMAAKPWLQKIRQLIAQGDLDLAQQELDEFKLRYPDEEIDPAIVNQLKGAAVD